MRKLFDSMHSKNCPYSQRSYVRSLNRRDHSLLTHILALSPGTGRQEKIKTALNHIYTHMRLIINNTKTYQREKLNKTNKWLKLNVEQEKKKRVKTEWQTDLRAWVHCSKSNDGFSTIYCDVVQCKHIVYMCGMTLEPRIWLRLMYSECVCVFEWN